MNSPYDQINDYCNKKNGATDKHKAIMLYRFYNDYYAAIDNYKKNHGNKNPSTLDCETFESVLLQSTSLDSSYTITSKMIDEEIDKELQRHEKKTKVQDFGLSVASGVVASFVFAVLALLFVHVCHNQVKSFIDSIYQVDEEITQVINQNAGLETDQDSSNETKQDSEQGSTIP